ncbi:MAG: M20/M25/M40 family metallo-hydrolase [bacterium]|nr:M20/M25/M40 family metallo-hydrolase [bacterium]
MDRAFEYIEANRERFLEELKGFVRQPSISATGEGVEACARLLKQLMENVGVETRVIEGYGHPVLYGEMTAPDAERTVLVYGHYDVQPPDPLSEWVSPPFEPVVRNGKLYGRGTGDNKGQLFAQLKGVESVVQALGQVPVNVKFYFEGEEEVGSRHVGAFVRDHKEMLSCDLVYCSDGHQMFGEQMEVVFGVRGMLYVEMEAKGPNRDLHSGNYGGWADSPAERLGRLIGKLKDEQNRVLIPGFYKGVPEPSSADLEAISQLPLSEAQVVADLGIEAIAGDPEVPFIHKRMFEPTLNVNGFRGGYTGEGMKTIIPASATMKIDMRLVVPQSPDDLFEKLKAYLDAIGYGDLEVRKLGQMTPWRTGLDDPMADRVCSAVEQGFGAAPYRVPSLGGSLPLAAFTQIPGATVILVPYGQHDENNHSPNECFAVDHFFKGARTMAALLGEMA